MADVHDQRTRRAGARAPAAQGPTSIDRDAVGALYGTALGAGTKGLPLTADGLTLADVAGSGWNVLRDGLPMPLMVLSERALANNLAAMADYCVRHGVALCPHGKTTMAPQLFTRQIEAGAWGMTAATPTHLRLYRRFGIQRVLYANELVEPAAIRWLAGELERSPEFELYCLVDSVAGVELLDAGLAGAGRRIGALLEVGYAGGRGGVRDRDQARRVAAAVDGSRALELAGIECFEGLLSGGDATTLARVDEFLASVREVCAELREHTSLRAAPEVLVSAGGSSYFDRVVATFADEGVGLVLRSGCYLTQDGGYYAEVSPLAGRRAGPSVLEDAIEIWAAVLSRPEPGRLICGMGRRDAPEDKGLPVPRRALIAGEGPVALHRASVAALNDQHAHLRVDPASPLAPGDLVGFAISHPCTAFDRWRVIPVVDERYTIRDAVLTFF